MKYKEIKIDFRNIHKLEQKGLKPVTCKSKISPLCLNTFIPVRKKQKMCLRCLLENN